MPKASENLLTAAAGGAIVALAVSVLTLFLPAELGGYNAWNDPHLALHNLAAILVRLIVFTAAGVAVASFWQRRRRHRRKVRGHRA